MHSKTDGSFSDLPGCATQAVVLAVVRLTLFQRGSQVILLQNPAARNAADESVALAEDGKFRCGQKVRGFGRDWHSDQKLIDVLSEELM